MTSNGKSCDYDTLTITIQYQPGLEMIGVGVAGQVYSLDDDIVLKACIIFQPPTTNCTTRDLWYHVSETVFNFSLLRDEKAVLRWLTQHPHPNIMEAIDTSLSLMVHCRLSQIESFGIRILFERSITFTVWVLLTRIYTKIIYSLTHRVVPSLVISAPAVHLDILILLDRLCFMDSRRLSRMLLIDSLWPHSSMSWRLGYDQK